MALNDIRLLIMEKYQCSALADALPGGLWSNEPVPENMPTAGDYGFFSIVSDVSARTFSEENRKMRVQFVFFSEVQENADNLVILCQALFSSGQWDGNDLGYGIRFKAENVQPAQYWLTGSRFAWYAATVDFRFFYTLEFITEE